MIAYFGKRGWDPDAFAIPVEFVPHPTFTVETAALAALLAQRGPRSRHIAVAPHKWFLIEVLA